MNVVTDTSVVLSVLTSEPERPAILQMTKGADLIAPSSVHWEIGNALSAMTKRGRLSPDQAQTVVRNYERIPIRFVEVPLAEAVGLAVEHGIYAYGAYVIVCARRQRCRLISLDKSLLRNAFAIGVDTLEVPPQ